MLNLISSTAIAATLALTPPGFGQPSDAVVAAPVDAPSAPSHTHSARASLAPGQARADYLAWLARNPDHRAEVVAFRDHLAAQGLQDVVPIWQLVRTSSSFSQCAADPFEVAPADKWANIASTLRFVRDKVEPAIGEVEALSAYRNETLNACSAGAPKSAHRLFFALDLTPVSADVGRDEMIRSICRAHGRDGRDYETGLGFYSGLRFHVDSNGFRRWGADGRGASSPCVSYS